MTLAVVGATGLVGRKMLQVLEERNFPVGRVIPVASEKSAGKTVHFRGKDIPVMNLEKAIEQKPSLVLFSAGGNISQAWAPRFAETGSYVVDNSSAWRMDPDVPLVVPEINPHTIHSGTHIIANPNCSTIQMVMVLAPLHKNYVVKRVVVSTYQSVTGTGKKAVEQLENERVGLAAEKVYPHPIDLNCLPHCDVFLENGYTREEMKMVNETRKILQDASIQITATAVRVPVMGGHSESVNVELQKPFGMDEIRKLLAGTPGIKVQDDPQHFQYPMPVTSHEWDEVFVGRLRKDESCDNALNLWIVSDNLRKGAATNAVQISEYLLEQELI
ncbi:MAG TPA: aspartate-semialdehyde dehydrogenase [Bacteroidetes bacterium]|nr:aspartate-semialdehyde dehydrogenase [Bacteroidota bacterium]